MATFMHANGCLPCVIDTETTGLDENKNEIVQIAVIPVNEHFGIDHSITPFVTSLRPNKPEYIDRRALEITQTELATLLVSGIDQFIGADLFCEWFENLNLAANKRIMPIACNWPFDRAFIQEWVGRQNFSHMFDARFRDLMSVTLYLNDRFWMKQDMAFPYPKHTLSYIASTLRVKREGHGAVDDAICCLECYKKLCTQHQI